MRRDIAERFWEKVVKSDGCWMWSGATSTRGYGRFAVSVQDKSAEAHRMSWMLTHGSVPPGQCVLHRCDTPPCVRPDHLFIGTKRDNAIDRQQKGRSASQIGFNNANAKVSESDVIDIRTLAALGATAKALAEAFSIDPTNVRHILRRATWSHVP